GGDAAIDHVVHEHGPQGRDHGLVLRQVNVLSCASAAPVEQGAHNDRGDEHGQHKVRVIHTGTQRIAVRGAGEMIDTGQGLQIVAKAQIVGVRTGVPLLCRTNHDDIGLNLHQVVVVQAPLAHGTTCKVVNDHIAQCHESFGNGHAFRVVKI